MKERENIEVYINVQKGETVCVCMRSKKRCKKECELDILERDRFRGWQEVMKRDRYGK